MGVEQGGQGSPERRSAAWQKGVEASLRSSSDASLRRDQREGFHSRFGVESLIGVGERSSEIDLPELTVRVGDEATGDIAEYTTNQLDTKIFNTLWDLWKTSDENGFLAAEKVIEALDTNVHVAGLYDPSKALLTSIGVPGASFWSSIIQQAPIGTIDKPSVLVERLVLIGGTMAGFASGHLGMAYSCLKALLHSEAHSMSATVIEHLIAGDHSASPHGNESPPNRNPTAYNAAPIMHSSKGDTATAEAARADQERIQRVQALAELARRELARRERADQERIQREQALAELARRELARRERADQEPIQREQARTREAKDCTNLSERYRILRREIQDSEWFLPAQLPVEKPRPDPDITPGGPDRDITPGILPRAAGRTFNAYILAAGERLRLRT